MDKIKNYRQFVKQILTEHAEIATSNEDDTVKAELIFDSDHDH
jgi:hypothetical protein